MGMMLGCVSKNNKGLWALAWQAREDVFKGVCICEGQVGGKKRGRDEGVWIVPLT